MTSQAYVDLLREALETEYGTVVQVGREPDSIYSVHHEARRLRRRVYGARDKARAAGDQSFDDLSILARFDGEVWIIKRQFVPNLPCEDGLEFTSTRSLDRDELPTRITSRGPNRPRSPYIPF